MDNILSQKVDNLSEQVKELSDAITRLVRIEEKYIGMERDLNGFGARLSKIEDEINRMSVKLALASSKGDLLGRWVERFLWILIAAAFAVFNPLKGA